MREWGGCVPTEGRPARAGGGDRPRSAARGDSVGFAADGRDHGRQHERRRACGARCERRVNYWRALHDSDQAVIVAQRQVPGRAWGCRLHRRQRPGGIGPGRCRTCRTTSAPAWERAAASLCRPSAACKQALWDAWRRGRRTPHRQAVATARLGGRAGRSASPPPARACVLRGGGRLRDNPRCEGMLGRSGEHGGADGDRLSRRGGAGSAGRRRPGRVDGRRAYRT